MKLLTAELKEVTTESFHDRNTKAKVIYPYLTFDLNREVIERNVDGFYVDIDIFDNNDSYTRLFELETSLTDHFKDFKKLTDELYVRFNFLGSDSIPTGDDNIKRRNLRFYVKTDWRTK